MLSYPLFVGMSAQSKAIKALRSILRSFVHTLLHALMPAKRNHPSPGNHPIPSNWFCDGIAFAQYGGWVGGGQWPRNGQLYTFVFWEAVVRPRRFKKGMRFCDADPAARRCGNCRYCALPNSPQLTTFPQCPKPRAPPP